MNYNDTDELIRFEHQNYLNSLKLRKEQNVARETNNKFQNTYPDERTNANKPNGRFVMKRKKEKSTKQNLFNSENDIICISSSDIHYENIIISFIRNIYNVYIKTAYAYILSKFK